MMRVQVVDLKDGDEFSIDDGQTWHVCAVVGWGSVSVYDEPDQPRTDDSLTVRIDVEREALVLVRGRA